MKGTQSKNIIQQYYVHLSSSQTTIYFYIWGMEKKILQKSAWSDFMHKVYLSTYLEKEKRCENRYCTDQQASSIDNTG